MKERAIEKGYVTTIYRRLAKRFGAEVHCPLHYTAPHELAVAVILSAQCTDEQVNRVTPSLFARCPDPEDYYTIPQPELEKLIYSTGFYKNKTKSIRAFCRMYVEELHKQMPRDLATLVKMPGVGRKTANVILQELYQIPSGVVVDTHVVRISKLLGLTEHSDPVKIERDLIGLVPERYWINWSLYMIFLGRSTCIARRPDCPGCILNDVCPSSSVKDS